MRRRALQQLPPALARFAEDAALQCAGINMVAAACHTPNLAHDESLVLQATDVISASMLRLSEVRAVQV